MLAGILPRLAADLSVSPGAAGYLVAAFSFAYAFSADEPGSERGVNFS